MPHPAGQVVWLGGGGGGGGVKRSGFAAHLQPEHVSDARMLDMRLAEWLTLETVCKMHSLCRSLCI